MSDASRPDRPTAMRIDPDRCTHGGGCRLLAPEIEDAERIPLTPATLDAMAACPSGALGWADDAPAGADERPADAEAAPRP